MELSPIYSAKVDVAFFCPKKQRKNMPRSSMLLSYPKRNNDGFTRAASES